jgi:4-amino-4-deoxy-L-arabinose transferase-like glycosyltransferase
MHLKIMSIEKTLVLLCILFFIFQSLFFLFYGNIHADELSYLYAVKMVLEGKILYKDFFYIQLPLLPYLYGFFLKFFGVSLLTGRMVSIIFSTGTVILSISIAKRIGGWKVSVLCALLLCLNPFQTFFSTIIRVYSPATFFLVLSIFFLTTKINPVLRNILAIISLCSSVECRLTVLPAFIPLLAYIYFFDYCDSKGKKDKVIFTILIAPLIASIIFFVVTLLPFALLAGFYEFLYQNLIYHLRIEMPNFGAYIVQKSLAISTFFKEYFFISTLLVPCIAFYWMNWRRYKFVLQNRKNGIEACMWIIIFLITMLHLTAKYLQHDYQVVIFPLACIVTALGVKKIHDQVESQNLRLGLILIFLCGVLITPVSYGRDLAMKVDGKSPIAYAREMGNYVRSITDKDDLILSSDTPLLAIEANRHLLKGFENMEYYPDWSTKMCEKYNLVNDEILERYINNRIPKLIIIGDLSYTMIQPGRRVIGSEKHIKILNMIEKNYSLIKKFPNLTHSVRGTNTYIYLRNE